jgi:dTDP-4-dehydrorhamnose 3,5-epimerase
MNFSETRLAGVYHIESVPVSDERGFLARSFCEREFQERGLDARVAQCSISYNKVRGTLRGMHYQEAPHAEAKLIRCVRGAVYDVAIDLRPDSPTFLQWIGVELRASPGALGRMLYIPEGCAHGFQTLEDDTELQYQISEFYTPAAGRGVRWNDPAIGVEWPEPVRVISEKDRGYPDLTLPAEPRDGKPRIFPPRFSSNNATRDRSI